jgi:PAS domain S-box-containing protein
VKKITHPEDIEKGKALYKELLDHKRDFYQREKRFWRKDGLPVWARSAAFAVRGTDGALRYVVSMVEDITERRRAKEKLRQLAAIVESASDAIIGRTLDNDIISWNPAAERMFGYTAEEAIGQPASILIPPARADEISQIMEQIKRGGRVEAFETIQVKKNGEPIAVSLTVSPIRDAAGEIVAFSAILRDITERKRLEKEVLEISAREQRRIGHDLHDGLGQYLAGTAFKAKVLEEVLAAESPGHTDAAKEIVKLINNAISQARALARGLSPIEVEASSLPSALEQLANETKKIFHVACLFKCNETNLSVASPAGLHLYRIAQEAVSNAVKHGKAREIEIELGLNGLQLLLVIRDKGKGFVSDSKRATGMGLNIMQYRANSIGGVLKIDSRRDHGTEIQCLVPTTLCSTPQPEFCYTNK